MINKIKGRPIIQSTTLTADPVPSVACGQLCIIETSACSVDEFGITPNWIRIQIDLLKDSLAVVDTCDKILRQL